MTTTPTDQDLADHEAVKNDRAWGFWLRDFDAKYGSRGLKQLGWDVYREHTILTVLPRARRLYLEGVTVLAAVATVVTEIQARLTP
jgi:hypothetical protein